MKITLLCEVNYKLIRYISKTILKSYSENIDIQLTKFIPERLCVIVCKYIKGCEHSAITAYVPIQNALISLTF